MISGLLIARKSVQAHAAVLFDDLPEFVFLDVFLGFLHGLLPGLFELRQFLFVQAHGFFALPEVRLVLPLDLPERRFLLGIVAGPNGVCAFKRHVLEHVRQARDPGILAVRANVHVREERKDRGFRPLDDNHRQAVRQDLHGRPLLEGCQVLRPDRYGQ